MGPKSKKSDDKTSVSTYQSFAYEELIHRSLSLNLTLQGEPPGAGDFFFLIVFNGITMLDGKWQDGMEFEVDDMSINLNDSRYQTLIASNPLIFLLRFIGGKVAKQEPDPLLNSDNRAAGTVDLLPLVLGEEEVFTTVHLVSLNTGESTGCDIIVQATALGENECTRIPLLLTMVSAHCMPLARDGTDYISAIGLTDIYKQRALNFNQSLSNPEAEKLVWASASVMGHGANTAISVPTEVKFVPDNFELRTTDLCRSFYWNALNRILVDPDELIDRLSSPFLIDVAGVPRLGKVEVRGRYMGWVDAGALLIPGNRAVSVCANLFFYNETQAEVAGGGLLDLPPTSAKGPTARENDAILDESGHNAYVVIRFDLMEPIIAKITLDALYDNIGFSPPEGPGWAIDELDIKTEPYDPFVDARLIRKECGALAVHRELSHLSCQGGVPMRQGIKRSAAHRLLARVRALLKNFAPENECSYIDWQDTVTGQHAASRRAVTASFAPQPPRLHLPDKVTAARCRIAGDYRLSEKYVNLNLKVAGSHPRSLMCKILRCLEERNDMDAKNYLIEALNSQTRNRYLLWILGAQEFDKGDEGAQVARAAFRIAAKGDFSDGTMNAIAWAASHCSNHANGNVYAAHMALKKMIKYHTLPREWDKVLKRWTDTSGEEEIFWTPAIIASENPMLITAAFFLCLRCYKFCEIILECVEKNCATRGSNLEEYPPSVDVYYLKAALFILKQQLDRAMDVTLQGIQKFGPSAMMSQMHLTCLSCMRNWDSDCENAYKEAERAGSIPCPSILFKSALSRFKTHPKQSMQRAALAHKMAPSGHTALLIGRIYAKLGEDSLAERWCAVAVKAEPLLADGWAMLSLLSMYQRNLDKARTMLRTAKQVGPISADIENDVRELMDIVELDRLPDSLVKNLCLETNK